MFVCRTEPDMFADHDRRLPSLPSIAIGGWHVCMKKLLWGNDWFNARERERVILSRFESLIGETLSDGDHVSELINFKNDATIQQSSFEISLVFYPYR